MIFYIFYDLWIISLVYLAGASAPVNKGSGTQPGSRYDATNMDRHSAVGGRMGNMRNMWIFLYMF